MSKYNPGYILLALLLLSPAISSAIDWKPAPADWPKYEYNRQPGEFKRDKYGMIDPSPDVVSLEYLPKDAYGFVDWSRALRDGTIAPKEFMPAFNKKLSGDDAENDQNILIRSKLDFMPDVIFPHSPHAAWLKCSTCHPKIFARKAGGTDISMAGIWKGQFCGRCHDRVAFPTRNCFRCHSAPRRAAK